MAEEVKAEEDRTTSRTISTVAHPREEEPTPMVPLREEEARRTSMALQEATEEALEAITQETQGSSKSLPTIMERTTIQTTTILRT